MQLSKRYANNDLPAQKQPSVLIEGWRLAGIPNGIGHCSRFFRWNPGFVRFHVAKEVMTTGLIHLQRNLWRLQQENVRFACRHPRWIRCLAW